MSLLSSQDARDSCQESFLTLYRQLIERSLRAICEIDSKALRHYSDSSIISRSLILNPRLARTSSNEISGPSRPASRRWRLSTAMVPRIASSQSSSVHASTGRVLLRSITSQLTSSARGLAVVGRGMAFFSQTSILCDPNLDTPAPDVPQTRAYPPERRPTTSPIAGTPGTGADRRAVTCRGLGEPALSSDGSPTGC